jgi:hypothetical protein
MKNYSDTIQRKFPDDSRLGFYKKPNIPASKLGKVLGQFKNLNIAEIMAFHQYGGLFSSGNVAFTPTMCHYDKGSFYLEDVKSAQVREHWVDVAVNQGGAFVTHNLRTDSAEAAALLERFLDSLGNAPKADDLVQKIADYSGYSKEAINWLELRDEVIRTIDLLAQRFQDGKLSILEFEEKKAELLARL